MLLEAFIGEELTRINNERHSRINPGAASFLSTPRTTGRGAYRARIGTALIRAGAWMSGARVDDCLDGALEPVGAQLL